MKQLLFLVFACIAAVSNGQVSLNLLFQDHMVLQRDHLVRFWGTGKPSEKISLSVDGITVNTVVDKSGKWEVLYPAHGAGGPYQIVIESTDYRSTIKDVWFGDVWIASGQSNMEWPLNGNVDGWQSEVANSSYNQIRFFKVPHQIGSSPQQSFNGGEWKIANPETSEHFSAVAWFFAKKNHLEKDVPVGIIESNWGGTPAEAWTPASRLVGVPGYELAAKEILDPKANWSDSIRANNERNETKYRRIGDEHSFLKTGTQLPGYNDSNWQQVALPNQEALTDFVWLRKHISLENTAESSLFLGDVTKTATYFVNGKLVGRESWQDDTPVLKIPENVLREGDNVIAIRCINDWDNKVYVGKPGAMYLEVGSERMDLSGDWLFSNQVEPPMPVVKRYNWLPGMIYHAMIAPIAGYTIKGVIWYQGESNADKPDQYYELFKTMIESWRIAWRQGEFPFLFVQLANFMERKPEPSESQWAALREAQSQVLQLPKTGMAVALDIGDALDIHPRNKRDVGERLWLAARNVAFGEALIHSGPTYKAHTMSGNRLVISYDYVGNGLISNGPVKGFALAGADGKYVWAEAKISDNQVVVWSDEITTPKYVRYGWADNPEVSLYNANGLPAVPFQQQL
ncbi:sialate O-acetylesterase [Marinoscillum furvescens]|uniref:Sialate O-acetylesterase n=1 Tax=Marinoscillum furvescens DSM 4134 TaxID=1122208 RepID=A0A3D9L1Z9_MARFU|nr:sialate O-acetylesterase [Marinoscillum furvescens]RED97932.1 sialate O-acetylesterase [Marinoscillum furvescens DSM 4134]